jgi:hypothetical protein
MLTPSGRSWMSGTHGKSEGGTSTEFAQLEDDMYYDLDDDRVAWDEIFFIAYTHLWTWRGQVREAAIFIGHITSRTRLESCMCFTFSFFVNWRAICLLAMKMTVTCVTSIFPPNPLFVLTSSRHMTIAFLMRRYL